MEIFNHCLVQEPNENNSQDLLGPRKERRTECQTSIGTDRKERWSKEVLEAIETHLSLLERGASRKLAARSDKSCMDGRMDSNRTCLTHEGASVHGNGHSSHCPGSERGPVVELSSQTPLPDGWEQFLDLRTGKVYYIDWNSYKRSHIDPRKLLQLSDHRASSVVEQAWSWRDLQSAETNSECLTDCSSYVAKKGSGDEMEVNSQWTAPMHREDWELMKSRGWPWSRANTSHSEISTEDCSPVSDQSSSSSCGAEADEIVKMTVKGCRQCLSYSMGPDPNSWCSHCGDALP